MAGMQRFITYIYAYENGKKQSNTGFAKIEIRGNDGRMEVHLREAGIRRGEGTIAFFFEKNGAVISFPIGKMRILSGSGDYGTIFKADRIGKSPYSFAEMEGILIRGDEESLFLSRWKEGNPMEVLPENIKEWEAVRAAEPLPKDIPPKPESVSVQPQTVKSEREPVLPKPNITSSRPEPISSKPEIALPERESVPRQPESVPLQPQTALSRQEGMPQPRPVLPQQESISPQPQTAPSRQKSEKTDLGELEEDIQVTEVPMRNIFLNYNWLEIWEHIKETHPSFRIDEKTLCVRIELKDLRELPKKYWYLGNNSFLLHGFFNYRYLLLGRLEEDRWFIGIPGVYQRQERVMAAIFGFPEFLPIRRPEEARESQETEEPVNWFGCWYHTLEE